MIIQATPYGTKKEEPFAFTYSGDFTDERVDGIGDVTLNTSGVFEVLSGTATVSVYILAGGGGGFYFEGYFDYYAGGGGGGNQTVTVELTKGTYEIVVGTGGTRNKSPNYNVTASNGGNTTAFGYTSTGGGGAGITSSIYAGAAGSPNGTAGTKGDADQKNGYGGAPNGGSNYNSGRNGIVRITFS